MHGTILVGSDGSTGSKRALEWAAEEAVLRDAEVQVVIVVDPDQSSVTSRARADEAQRMVEEAASGLAGRPSITTRVETGAPVDVLTMLSEQADLLVLGSHGTSSLIHSALGSVSDACARLAACPVVVLPAQRPS